MDEHERDTAYMRNVFAALRLADDDPEAATVALVPVIAGSVAGPPVVMEEAFLLEAVARDTLGDVGAAGGAIERALDLAEPDGLLFPFLVYPVRELLERHSRYQTSHASLVAELLNLLAGKQTSIPRGETEQLSEPLSESETRVLRYLPTNLSLRDIGSELYVSVHTIKTHTKHIYGKLDVHGRAEAVERARALGLLAPSMRKR
jgi:LuxR family maltose regulon positive regulatory protein